MRIAIILATAVIVGGASTVSARPAATTYLANMRTGPGVGYPVVAAIPQGALVDMGACAKSWCRVTWNGVSGYVSSGLLTQGIAVAPAPQRAPLQEEYADSYRYIYGGWGPYFCDPYFDPYCTNASYFGGGGWYWYDQRRRRWRPHAGPHPRPRPPHGQVRPRPDAGPPGAPNRFIPGRPPAPTRWTPGAIGRPSGAPIGGAAISGPRGGSVGGPIGGRSGGGFGGSRGGSGFSGGGSFGGGGGGHVGGSGGHGGGGFGHGR